MDKKYIKVVFLGESGVGKTSLINRYINNSYKESEVSTFNASNFSKTIKYEGKEYTFDIWDTPGSDAFKSLTKIFLKESKIFVLVYDTTDKKSFLNLQYWLDYILEEFGSKSFIILIGNKSDLINKRQVKESDGSKFANLIKALFIQTSAKTNDNWSLNFENLLKDYLTINKKEIPEIEDTDDYLDDLLLY